MITEGGGNKRSKGLEQPPLTQVTHPNFPVRPRLTSARAQIVGGVYLWRITCKYARKISNNKKYLKNICDLEQS